MKRNKFLPLLMVLIIILGNVNVFAKTEYDITSGAYVRYLGRGETTCNGRSFNYPQSGFETEFSGTKIEIYANVVSVAGYADCYFNVTIDGGEPERIKINNGWNTIYEDANNAEKHVIQFIRSSEAIRGKLFVAKIATEGGTPSAAEPRRKKIEFYGDSYTVGYGNRPELDQTGYSALNTDHWYSYASVTARHFNADANVIAYSGRGLCVNENGTAVNTITNQFTSSDLRINNDSYQTAWDFSQYTPDIVVLFLGTNDAKGITNSNSAFTENDFYNSYTKMLKNIRDKYPKANIICCSKATGPCMEAEITRAVETFGGADKGIYRIVFNPFGTSTFNHPNVNEHKQIAEQLIDLIENIDGIWDGYAEGLAPDEPSKDIVKTKSYIEENFDGYTSYGNVMPDDWYSIKLRKNGHVALTDIYSAEGKSGSTGDNSVSFKGATSQRMIKAFDEAIPAGNDFYVDFDVYRENGERWYMYLLPEYDLEYDSEMHTSASNENVDSNIFIGMCSEKVLGYAKNQKTNNAVSAFNNDDEESYDYECEIPYSGWHHVSAYVQPVSRTCTNITVSVDYGKEYSQSTKLNYSTSVEAIKGIGISGLEGNGDKDIRFDNISVYEGTEPPAVKNVAYMLGTKAQEGNNVSPLTDCIMIEFTKAISAESIENAITIINKNNEAVPFTYVLSEDKTVIAVIPTGPFNGNAEYTLKISGIKDATGYASIPEVFERNFNTTALGECEILFLDKNNSQIGTTASTSYGVKTIEIEFGIPVDFEDAKNKVVLYKGNSVIPVIYTHSDDFESIMMDLGDKLLSPDNDYRVEVSEGIALMGYTAVTEKGKVFTFEVTNDSVEMETAIYYENNFNNYITSGLPAGFYRYNPNDNNTPGTIVSDVREENEDRAVKFSGSVNQLIRTQLDTVVEFGMPFTVEFDICRNNSNGFYIDLLPECDITHLTDPIHTDSTLSDYHTQDRNIAIGMHSTVKSGSGAVNSPHLGYANAKRSGSGLSAFTDEKGNYCDIPADGKWHSVKLDVRPVSPTSTYLTVAVDEGTEYNADSKLDFTTQRFAGLGIFALYNDNTSGAPLVDNDVSFDNIRVYSKSKVKNPTLENIELTKYDGTVQDVNYAVSVATTQISVRFDTAISEDTVRDNIKIYCDDNEIFYTYNMSVDGSTVILKPNSLFDYSTTYRIEVLTGITSPHDSRMNLQNGKTVYFRTENQHDTDAVNSVTDFKVEEESGKVTASADILKMIGSSGSTSNTYKYTLMLSEYKTVTKDINNNSQINDEPFYKLLNVKYMPINLENSSSGIYSFNQDTVYSSDTEFVIGYLMEFPTNKILCQNRIDVK